MEEHVSVRVVDTRRIRLGVTERGGQKCIITLELGQIRHLLRELDDAVTQINKNIEFERRYTSCESL